MNRAILLLIIFLFYSTSQASTCDGKSIVFYNDIKKDLTYQIEADQGKVDGSTSTSFTIRSFQSFHDILVKSSTDTWGDASGYITISDKHGNSTRVRYYYYASFAGGKFFGACYIWGKNKGNESSKILSNSPEVPTELHSSSGGSGHGDSLVVHSHELG